MNRRRSSPTRCAVDFRDGDERVGGRQLIDAEARRRTAALETMIDPFIVVRTVRDAAGQIVDLGDLEILSVHAKDIHLHVGRLGIVDQFVEGKHHIVGAEGVTVAPLNSFA